MDADRKRLMAERRHLLSKLTDIELVEDSVKELYVQVKVRTATLHYGTTYQHAY